MDLERRKNPRAAVPIDGRWLRDCVWAGASAPAGAPALTASAKAAASLAEALRAKAEGPAYISQDAEVLQLSLKYGRYR